MVAVIRSSVMTPTAAGVAAAISRLATHHAWRFQFDLSNYLGDNFAASPVAWRCRSSAARNFCRTPSAVNDSAKVPAINPTAANPNIAPQAINKVVSIPPPEIAPRTSTKVPASGPRIPA